MELERLRKDFIPYNVFSRPGEKCSPMGIAIHWPEWPGASAQRVRDYFAGLANQDPDNPDARYASTQFTLDSKEIIQLMPLKEKAYHVGKWPPEGYTRFTWRYFKKRHRYPKPNRYLLGVEVSHKDATGEWDVKTLYNLMELCTYLCIIYGWDPTSLLHITTHHEITGKACPKWFVDHPDKLEYFRIQVKKHVENRQEDERYHTHDEIM